MLIVSATAAAPAAAPAAPVLIAAAFAAQAVAPPRFAAFESRLVEPALPVAGPPAAAVRRPARTSIVFRVLPPAVAVVRRFVDAPPTVSPAAAAPARKAAAGRAAEAPARLREIPPLPGRNGFTRTGDSIGGGSSPGGSGGGGSSAGVATHVRTAPGSGALVRIGAAEMLLPEGKRVTLALRRPG